MLTDKRVNPAAKFNDAIRSAASDGHIKVVMMLLEDERVNPAATDNDAIRKAARYGCDEVVSVLLADKRINPAAGCNDAIRAASRNGHSKIVAMLLEDERVNPSDNDDEAIVSASCCDRDYDAEFLMCNRINPISGKRDVNQLKVQNARIDVVKMLLSDRRVNPSAKDNYALKNARSNEIKEIILRHLIIRKLLIQSIDIGVSDVNGFLLSVYEKLVTSCAS